jgi:hypothetical protein
MQSLKKFEFVTIEYVNEFYKALWKYVNENSPTVGGQYVAWDMGGHSEGMVMVVEAVGSLYIPHRNGIDFLYASPAWEFYESGGEHGRPEGIELELSDDEGCSKVLPNIEFQFCGEVDRDIQNFITKMGEWVSAGRFDEAVKQKYR